MLVMVAGLPKSKSNTDDEKEALAAAHRALGPIRQRLIALADTDAAAFDQVMAGYRLPKVTDQEKSARTQAIQLALQGATMAPLETLRGCAEALELAGVVARCGSRSAASDVGVAVGLLEAAAAGAEANVRINLDGLSEEAFRASAREDAARLMAAVVSRSAVARARLGA